MKWITRERVKGDRVACPWLIRKLVDPNAEFLFVPKELVLEASEREGAIPFDVPGVELGHHEGKCIYCLGCPLCLLSAKGEGREKVAAQFTLPKHFTLRKARGR